MRETLARHAAGADPYNAGLRATMVSNGMSNLWADLLMACISVEPAGRPQSVQQVFERLGPIGSSSGAVGGAIAGASSFGVSTENSEWLTANRTASMNDTFGLPEPSYAPAYQPPAPRRGVEEASLFELLPNRFFAHVVDAVLGVVSVLPAAMVMAVGPHKEVEQYYGRFDGGPSDGTKFVAALAVLFGVGYFVIKQIEAMSKGQTLGKKFIGIEVRMKDGRLADGGTMFWRLFSVGILFGVLAFMQEEGKRSQREFAEVLMNILSILNVGMYLFNRGRGLQDVFAGTYVSKKD